MISTYIDKYFLKKPLLRKIITRLVEGNKNFRASFFNLDIYLNSVKEHGYLRSSRLINSSAFLRDEVPVLLNLANLVEDRDTFVDVGANIGMYSVFFSHFKKLKKNIQIFAYEANPNTFKRLNINAIKYNFNCINIAISDTNKTLEFVEGAVSHVFTTVENKSTYNFNQKTVKVKSSTLCHENIPGNHIILKIDVEGQELNVLNGARKLFIQNRIKAVFIDGFTNPEIPQFLLNFNFSLMNAQSLESTFQDGCQLLAIKN
jgi:FkbM family methyltransferase